MKDSNSSRRRHMEMNLCLLAGVFAGSKVGAQDVDAFAANLASLKDSLVRIHADKQIGIGFLAEMGGKQYIVTTANVVAGHLKLSFKTLAGEPVAPRSIQLSATRDLARFQVSGQKAIKLKAPVVGEPAAILEYDRSSTIASRAGAVTSIGKDMIEISAEFKAVNRGAPIISEELAAGGVADHLIYYKAEGGVWQGAVRGFAYRLDDAAWYAANWKSYNQTFGKSLREADEFRSIVYGIASEWIKRPKAPIETEESLGLDFDRFVKAHNGLVSDLGKSHGDRGVANKKMQAAFKKNLESLVRICDGKAKTLEFVSSDKKVTPYLRVQFKWRALELKKFGKFLNTTVEGMDNFRWV